MNKNYKDEWFAKGDKDYKSAIQLLEASDSELYENVAFHCQQCAEKYLKGFLVFNNQEIEKTHSIEKILKKCQLFDDFSIFYNLIDLTAFAVTFRYPGEYIEVDKTDILNFIDMLEKLIKFIKDLVAEDRLL